MYTHIPGSSIIWEKGWGGRAPREAPPREKADPGRVWRKGMGEGAERVWGKGWKGGPQ